MSRYVDADVLRELLIKYIGLTNGFDRAFSEAPSINIVRCDECQYYEDGHCESAEMWQSINGCTTECESMSRNADDFCSYGERREP